MIRRLIIRYAARRTDGLDGDMPVASEAHDDSFLAPGRAQGE